MPTASAVCIAALAHDQSDDVAAMCAQRDSDANLAGAAGDGVGFYP
jgi:hypothetical protein